MNLTVVECITGCVFGLLCGWLNLRLTRAASGRWPQRVTVQHLITELSEVVSATPQRSFSSAWVRTMQVAMILAGRQLLTAAIMLLPVAAGFMTLLQLQEHLANSSCRAVLVSPVPEAMRASTPREPAGGVRNGFHEATNAAMRNELTSSETSPGSRIGWSRSRWPDLLLLMLGFSSLPGPDPTDPTIETVIVRPLRGNSNPLWPWVGDAELSYLVTVCAVSGTAAAFGKRRRL